MTLQEAIDKHIKEDIFPLTKIEDAIKISMQVINQG